MITLRRWWSRHRLQILLVAGLLIFAWGFRATQGTALLETYRWLSQPFVTTPTRIERITNARIVELQARLAELEVKNQKLQQLLGYVSIQSQTGIAAPVIGRGADHWWHQLILGRGEQHGIQPGYIVIGPGGIVGRITHVTPNTSQVLLVSDPMSRVGVVISRSRAMGVMRGQSKERVVIEFFHKDPDVRRGDMVSTSNFSQLFPPSLPVGRVVALNLNKTPAPEATIELAAPLDSLEDVMVYPHHPILIDTHKPAASP
jgi:rod shape-determining protein MreC